MQSWNCHKCTYLHKYPSQRCSMCSALRVSKKQMRDFIAGKKIVDNTEITMSSPTNRQTKMEVEEEREAAVAEELPSSGPRRLGMLRCPSAGSLGWGGEGAPAENSISHDVAAPSPIATADGINNNNESSSLKADYLKQVSKETTCDMDCSPTVKNARDISKGQQQEEVNSENATSNGNRKRPRLTNSSTSAQQPTTVNANGSLLNNGTGFTGANSEELGETTEPMKDGAYHAKVLVEPPTKEDTEPLHLSTTLDYEPLDNESGERSQILTVTYHGGSSSSANANSPVVTVVGTISGRARLYLLPLVPSEDDESKASTSTNSEEEHTISLEVFGYRIPSSEKHDPIIINRPDWMHSLPISVVSKNPNQVQGKRPTVLRLRVQSIASENNNDGVMSGGGGECYYSAYPAESYELNVLPPAALYPGNYTSAGVGVCTILKTWKDTLDKITDEMVDSSASGDAKKTETAPLGGKDEASTLDKSAPGPAAPSENPSRILLCGAKGVGKSTLLRYATNRILSTSSCQTGTSSSKQCINRVAILDLDCGQAELSPPGMLTLTVVSKPLLSDPPVHMVCGGSCDHNGRKMESGDDKSQSEEHSVKHEAAYYFGDITSKSDPDTYIQMTSQLMQRYGELQKQQANGYIPLLVNTDGWVKGLGYEILSAIIGAVNPGHIIQIMGNTKAKSFDMSSHSGSQNATMTNGQPLHQPRLVHVIQSFDESLLPFDDNSSRRSMSSTGSTNTVLASSSDHRDHRLCAYFLGGHNEMMNLRSKIPGEDESISFHKERGLHDPNNIIGITLAAMRPYAVPFNAVQLYPPSGLLDSISELKPLWGVRGDLACNDLLDSLNGSIVSLCSKLDAFDAPLANCNDGTGVPILNCVGLGIIRSIDQIRRVFYVLTPAHPRLLENVTSFVGGNITLPLECVHRGVHSDSFPFLSCGNIQVNTSLGADVMKSRNHSRGKK